MQLDRFMVGLTMFQLLKGAAEAYAEIQDLPTGQQLLELTDRHSRGMLKQAAVAGDWDVFNRIGDAYLIVKEPIENELVLSREQADEVIFQNIERLKGARS